MNTDFYAEETLSDLTLSEVAQLQRENAHYKKAMQALGVPGETAYQQSRACEALGNRLMRFQEMEAVVRDNGYKSLAKFVEGNLRRVRTDRVPRKYAVAPSHHVVGKTTAKKAQKQWEQLLPMLNELLDDPLLNEADWANLDEAVQTLPFEAFNTYLLDIKRQEVNGEFDEDVQKAKVEEILRKRLRPAQVQQGLLPSSDVKMLPSSEARVSQTVRWVNNTGFSVVNSSNLIVDLASKQIEAMSEEDQELLCMLNSL